MLLGGVLSLASLGVVTGQLLVAKQYSERHPVIGVPLTIEYRLYNRGEEPLTNIELLDVTFPPSKFIIKKGIGSLPLKLSELKSKEKHVHRMIVIPIQLGQFADVPAQTVFRRRKTDSEEYEGAVLTLIQDSLLTHVITPDEYNASHRSHRGEWLIFVGISTLLVGYSYFRYISALSTLRSVLKATK